MNSLKSKAKLVWESLRSSNPYGNYIDSKIAMIDQADEDWIIIQMFDIFNQEKLWRLLSEEERNKYKSFFYKFC